MFSRFKGFIKPAIVMGMLVCFAAYLRSVDYTEVIGAVKQVGYRYVLLIFVTFLAYFLGTISWQYCMPQRKDRISTGRLFWIRHVGETIALINPASIIGGDALKIHLLHDQGIEERFSIVSIITSRAILIITQVFLSIVVIVVLTIQHKVFIFPWIPNILLYMAAGILILVLFILILDKLIAHIHAGLFKLISSFKLKARTIIATAKLEWSSNKSGMWISAGFALLHWILGSLEFYFILMFLGVNVSLTEALLVDMGVMIFKTAGAFIPAQIGVEEYGNKIMLAAVGVSSASIWVAASILRRSRQLLWILAGLVIYFLIKKSYPLQNANGNSVC